MDTPSVITSSGLYSRLSEDQELLTAALSLRGVAASLAETVSRTVPSFTDHTVRHMDALWGVADRVLAPPELIAMSPGEVFILVCGFYLHDIGMAYAATDEGLRLVRSSPIHASITATASAPEQSDPSFQARALAHALRTLHPNAASELATAPVPGTEVYLFESLSIRDAWGETCGGVAASHHWGLDKVESEFGSTGVVPLPGGRRGDIGYSACLLRLIDYAHLNRDRAPRTDRAFRAPLERESLIHWLAQESVDGPERDGADLVYRASAPLSDVDAWWLYYEMLKGLDNEIRMTRRYLDRRASSQGRLTLQGVRGVTSPEEASVFIPTKGFLPIEINLRTGSIERLVQLLAGESLYGPNPMAAVRELIQNSRDAESLKAAIAVTDFDKATLSIPIRLSLKTENSPPLLEIKDPGVGMTRKVMTDYLLSIASDYWRSQFHTDFPGARERGFRPAGKFGIGFLSVFMLGDDVTVESNRDGGERYRLHLRGVGRRGEIRSVPSQPGSGTTVCVELREAVVDSLRQLAELVRVYAPMLPHQIDVDVNGQVTSIPAGWLHQLDVDEFYRWTLQAVATLRQDQVGRYREIAERDLRYLFRGYRDQWALDPVDRTSWPKARPEYREGRVRLLASFEGSTLLSLRGLAIQPIATPGFVGVIDSDSATPDVSRRQATWGDVPGVLDRAIAAIRPQVVENLNALVGQGFLIDKLGFVARCVSLYGRQTILEASLPWISVLKLPGEVELASCAVLLERLTKSASLFVAFGTGPWSAMKLWGALEPKVAKPELAIVLDDSQHAGPGYHSGSDERIGALLGLWPQCADTPLFGTILRLAAEAWQVSIEDLSVQDGWRHSGSTLWGRLVRP